MSNNQRDVSRRQPRTEWIHADRKKFCLTIGLVMVIVAAVGFVAELFTRAVHFRPSTERLVTTARSLPISAVQRGLQSREAGDVVVMNLELSHNRITCTGSMVGRCLRLLFAVDPLVFPHYVRTRI